MRRFLRRLFGAVLVAVAAALVVGKLWLVSGGPYLEALPLYPYCAEAGAALQDGRPQDALELAEAGGCDQEAVAARAEWNRFGAVVGRCAQGIWTGRGEDGYGIGCAMASDLVVLGDVRDLIRQGVTWIQGGQTDPVLVALSAAGVALTFTPQIGAGASLFKSARRAGSIGEPLARSVVKLAGERAWKPLAGMLGDAGRIGRKLPIGRATKALAYADDADDLAAIARFVEAAPNPLLGLKWGGKGVARLADDGLYAQAALRGPAGIQLALERGGKALLARQPLMVFAAKTLYVNGDRLLPLVLGVLAWPWVWGIAAAIVLVGSVLVASGRRRGLRRGSREAVA